jgi:hypothetical protein
VDDSPNLRDFEADLAGERIYARPNRIDVLHFLGDQAFPAVSGEIRHAGNPVRIVFGAAVILEKILARDVVTLGEAYEAALVVREALIDVVELRDQRINARLFEPQRFHLGDDVFFQLPVLAFLCRRQRRIVGLVMDVMVVQAAKALVAVGDLVESCQHGRRELGLDGGERHCVFDVVLLVAITVCTFALFSLLVIRGLLTLQPKRCWIER